MREEEEEEQEEEEEEEHLNTCSCPRNYYTARRFKNCAGPLMSSAIYESARTVARRRRLERQSYAQAVAAHRSIAGGYL
jgi:hypothetical protein